MKCVCGNDLKLPATFIGYTEQRIPVAQFSCACGAITNAQIDTMAPYAANRSEAYPPKRGEYIPLPDCVQFTCPVCQGISPISAPTHQIDPAGKVTPSVVCPHRCGFHTHMTLVGWDK
jgi:hypothetical protein